MSLFERAEQLRDAFRNGFSRAHETQRIAYEDLLAFRIAGDPYAVRLTEVAALQADRKVVPLPSAVPELLGIAALRGAIAPVYALGPWLGYPSAPLPRWLMLTAGPDPVWLAIDHFEAQLRVERTEISGDAHFEGERAAHLRGAVRAADALRPIVQLASVLEAIAARSSPSHSRSHS
jgi:chemotaxis signal transduction protein